MYLYYEHHSRWITRREIYTPPLLRAMQIYIFHHSLLRYRGTPISKRIRLEIISRERCEHQSLNLSLKTRGLQTFQPASYVSALHVRLLRGGLPFFMILGLNSWPKVVRNCLDMEQQRMKLMAPFNRARMSITSPKLWQQLRKKQSPRTPDRRPSIP